ncbi:hypothetical protein [Shinella sp. M27]|uniref:hypothetical protein n=1 Tax=Shinella sp. M27 TaxID=3368614 RepID=UPI003BA07D59
MQLYPVAGSRIYIGPAVTSVPDDEDMVASLFTSVVWTEIDGWQTMGAIGDSKALITESAINRGRDIKAGGTKNAGSMQNQFLVLPDDDGQLALIAAENTRHNYPFKIVHDDAPPALSSVVTMTIAAPGVISWAGHTLVNGNAVKFSTTGALPTGLVAGTTYYVVSAASGTLSVSATPGGSAITTTGTQSGVHTATTVPTGSTKLFYGIVMGSPEQGGGANTARLVSTTIEINSAILRIPAAAA